MPVWIPRLQERGQRVASRGPHDKEVIHVAGVPTLGGQHERQPGERARVALGQRPPMRVHHVERRRSTRSAAACSFPEAQVEADLRVHVAVDATVIPQTPAQGTTSSSLVRMAPPSPMPGRFFEG